MYLSHEVLSEIILVLIQLLIIVVGVFVGNYVKAKKNGHKAKQDGLKFI